MTNWKDYKLGEICSKIGSGATPRGGGDTYLDSGEYALIRSQNVLDFAFSYNGLAYISKEQAQKLNNVALEQNDILLNITGDSVARVCKVPANLIPARVNQHVAIIRPDAKILQYDYLKYYLLNPVFKDYLLMLSSSGATRNAITKGMIENLSISVPDIDTQTAIAEILSSLDDKIELNNKINQELENLAQTLFKQWFIDFEFPNEKGEPYKSSSGEMVDSELGEIPKGWEVKSLDEIADINLGGTPSRKKEEYWSGNIPWVNSGAINENYILYPVELITELGLHKSSTKLIPKYSTLIAITGATLGQVSYSLIDACYNQSVISLTSDKNISEFIHLMINSIITELIKHQTGGAQQHINKGNVESFKVFIPYIKLLENFKSVVSDIYFQIESNLRENQELTNLRDTLLPKLISGELEVADITAEKA